MVWHQYKGQCGNRAQLVFFHQDPNGNTRMVEVGKYRRALLRGGDNVVNVAANRYTSAAKIAISHRQILFREGEHCEGAALPLLRARSLRRDL